MNTLFTIAAPTTASVVPGDIVLAHATRADYHALSRHHYRHQAPATFCRIVGAWHRAPGSRRRRLVGVAVLSWPVPMCVERNRFFHVPPGYGNALRFANANVRTISRVIVHPQFRALGLARRLVRDLIDACPTRYVESSTTMGPFINCFTGAGMARVDDGLSGRPAYFVIDRLPT
jgi:GNAT superfamily N-acetyltransferase